MTDENKPREFWIDTEDSYWSDKPIEPFEGDPGRVVHVIEYRSYTKLKEDHENLLDEYHVLRTEVEALRTVLSEYKKLEKE